MTRARGAGTAHRPVLLAIAAMAALLLGLFGVYGVISYAVSQRRQEIGIRLALGAGVGEIRRLFLRRGIALTALGIATGLVAATATTRLMHLPLFGITPLDSLAFALMPVLLAAAAILASYVPARRRWRSTS
jgi:ABC-type antimicrobial peptide transport system permease subunit